MWKIDMLFLPFLLEPYYSLSHDTWNIITICVYICYFSYIFHFNSLIIVIVHFSIALNFLFSSSYGFMGLLNNDTT